MREYNLSSHELKIVKLIVQEESNRNISRKLNYSQRMIEYHIASIAKKVGVQTRAGIAYKAYKILNDNHKY